MSLSTGNQHSELGHHLDLDSDEENTSPTAGNHAAEESFTPSIDDVVAVRDTLLTFFPPELTYIPLNLGEYWAPISDKCTQPHTASASESPRNDASSIYLLSAPILERNGSGDDEVRTDSDILLKVKAVRFKITSQDQGWCSDDSLRNTYNGFTWHEAAIFRPSLTQAPDETLQRLADVAPAHIEFASTVGYTRELEVKGTDNQSRWLVHKNFTAFPNPKTHVVYWVQQTDHEVPTGAGDGEGFIHLLQPGDRIALVSRALYPGWSNTIEKAEITVSYGLA
ncbi:hypothetical protein C8F01DRAFT_990080 [Mycena amicta]|nr:hypothetical protein C8F01DRAFT_990080 [Mycena amicta]